MDSYKRIADLLLEFGRSRGPFLPWHTSKDPYHWLIAESLLRRTTRTAANKVYVELIKKYSSFIELSQASTDDLFEIISWIGLGEQRSRHLKKLSEQIIIEFGGEVPTTRQELMSLTGVGEYIADAILLYVFGINNFPIDPNVQRVLRRFLGFPTSVGTRHSEPYKDQIVREFVEMLGSSYNVSDIRDIHRGVLLVGWEHCRPKPICIGCPLQQYCVYHSTYSKESKS